MIRGLFVLLLALVCCSPAKAQTGQMINCPLVNTTTFNAGPVGSTAISNCLFTLPPTAMAMVFVQGTVTCGSTSSIALVVRFINTVNNPRFGASFNGQITGSVLTVNSMITGPPFAIYPSTTPGLYDAFSGSHIPLSGISDTALRIVSQATSSEPGGAFGGRGTYNLNTSVGSPIAAETMWALPQRSNAVTGGSNIYEQLACQNGTTLIESFAGSLSATDLGGPGAINWVQVEMLTEIIGGQPVQSASLTNGQVIIVLPSMLQGGLR